MSILKTPEVLLKETLGNEYHMGPSDKKGFTGFLHRTKYWGPWGLLWELEVVAYIDDYDSSVKLYDHSLSESIKLALPNYTVWLA